MREFRIGYILLQTVLYGNFIGMWGPLTCPSYLSHPKGILIPWHLVLDYRETHFYAFEPLKNSEHSEESNGWGECYKLIRL